MWQENWDVQRYNIVKRIGRCNGAGLGGATVQYWEANWEVQRCKVGGETIQNWQVNWEVQRCNIVRQLPRGKGSELGGELGGARVQIGRFNGPELTDATVQNREGQGCNIGRRIGRSNDAQLHSADLAGELGCATMQN
jgi:hypothetical protein